MIKKFNNFLSESVRDKMTPISKEEILRKISDNFVKILMDEYDFDNVEDAQKWIIEHINEITRLSSIHSADKIIDRLFDMTDLLKRKLNLESGGIVDNGHNKSESVIVNKNIIKEVYDFITTHTSWGIGGSFTDVVRTWDIMDKMYDVKEVKLSIPCFSRDKTFDGRFTAYLAFTFDIGVKNNPSLVFNANNTKSPYIWVRISNAGWVTISLDESDLKDKIKKYIG